ncbi:Hypothetical protein PYTT_0082 [Akkermansia glycaniphila]|uniref:Uncharacterized protein n=2 Tax=Akkermansia glycaniphila TaxID=1679444 RepID=A0A1H6KAM9_9BACT|nr:Hypothetical protein PYTT_0082 [Akkermansia glycaniphila]
MSAGHAQEGTSITPPSSSLHKDTITTHVSTTLNQRTAQLDNLALLPPDTEIFCTIPNLPEFTNTFITTRWSQILHLDEDTLNNLKNTVSQSGITSVTVATGVRSSRNIAQFLSIYVRLVRSREQIDAHMRLYEDKLDPDQPPVINDAYYAEEDRWIDETLLPILEDLIVIPVPNVLAVFDLSPERAAKVRMIFESSGQNIEGLIPEYFRNRGCKYTEGTFSGRFWKGIRFDGKTLAQYVQKNSPPHYQEMFRRLNKRETYLLATMQGDKLIVSLCDDPDKDLKIAKTPQESILSTDKVSMINTIPDKKYNLLFHIDQQFHEALTTQLRAFPGTDRISSIVPTPLTDVILHTSGNLLAKCQASPVSGIIWQDQGIHALLSYGKDHALKDTQATIDQIHATIDSLHGSITPGEHETHLHFHLKTE